MSREATSNPRFIRQLLCCSILALLPLAAGCAASMEDEGESVDSAEQLASKKGPKMNENEVLLVSLGASTSAGVTFDPELFGVALGFSFAATNHLDDLGTFIEATSGQEVDNYNLAVPSATSSELIANQLDDALEEVARYPLGTIVTIEGGGNDLRAFQVQHIAECLSPEPADQYACIVELNNTIQTAAANVTQAITAIRAVNPDADVIIQTQYNPLYGALPDGTACADPALLQIADLSLEGDPRRGDPVQGLNVAMRAVAAAHDAGVADVAGYLYATGDFSDPSHFSTDCTHLTGVREALPAFGLPADTTGKGYATLLGAYVNAYQSL